MKKFNINKNLLIGFVAVLLVSGFAYLIGDMVKAESDKNLAGIRAVQKTQLEEKQKSEIREQLANFKRDSALSVLNIQTNQMNQLKFKFDKINSNISGFRNVYERNQLELKNIQNEKDHIIDVPISEQSDFLSKYQYKEY